MSSFPSGHISLRILCELQNNEKKKPVQSSKSYLSSFFQTMLTKLKQNKDERGLSRRAIGYQHEPEVTNTSHRSTTWATGH